MVPPLPPQNETSVLLTNGGGGSGGTLSSRANTPAVPLLASASSSHSYQSIATAATNPSVASSAATTTTTVANNTIGNTIGSSSSNERNGHTHTNNNTATPRLRPMAYLTHQQRKHNVVVVSLLAVFLAMIGSLALWWKFSLEVGDTVPQQQQQHQSDTSGSLTSDDGPATMSRPSDRYYSYNNNNNNFAKSSTGSRSSGSSSSTRTTEQNQVAHAALDTLNRRSSTTSPSVGVHDGCETTVLILRHCEKFPANNGNDDSVHGSSNKKKNDNNGSDKGNHCSYLGLERAAFLVTLFESDHTTTNNNNSTEHHSVLRPEPNQLQRRWPAPDRLYALSTERKSHANYREWETLQPLSQVAHVDVVLIDKSGASFAKKHFFPQLQTGELCGKLVVIAWKHSRFPSLANALGCGPDNGCPVS